ncbi:MAG: hypothetical protein EZS28_025357 [Streblomastix strix]|uniref:MATE efflux family protein n=1 Tax=Streblomastix strix TaxID=222440 RepID=A0A5J4V9F0_9EUKA|nr:MAG: hypothetical protein EZS28_025357 [Streblomastix strix]
MEEGGDDDNYLKDLVNGEVDFVIIMLSCTLLYLIYNLSSLFFGSLLGYRGAAFATLSGQLIGVVIFMCLIFGRKDFRNRFKLVKLTSLKPQFKFLLRAILVGCAVGLVNSIDELVWTMYLILTQGVGEAEVTAAGYSSSLYEAILIPTFGIASALQLIVSNNIGSGNIQTAKSAIKTTIKILTPYTIAIIILFVSIPRLLLKIFVEDSSVYEDEQFYQDTMNAGQNIIRILSAFAVVDIIGYPSTTVLQAVDYEIVTPISSLIGLILTFVVPWIIIALIGQMNALTVVWTTFMLTMFGVIRVIPELIVLLRGKWVEESQKMHDELMKEGQDNQNQEMENLAEEEDQPGEQNAIQQEGQQLEEILEVDEENGRIIEDDKTKLIDQKNEEKINDSEMNDLQQQQQIGDKDEIKDENKDKQILQKKQDKEDETMSHLSQKSKKTVKTPHITSSPSKSIHSIHQSIIQYSQQLHLQYGELNDDNQRNKQDKQNNEIEEEKEKEKEKEDNAQIGSQISNSPPQSLKSSNSLKAPTMIMKKKKSVQFLDTQNEKDDNDKKDLQNRIGLWSDVYGLENEANYGIKRSKRKEIKNWK